MRWMALVAMGALISLAAVAVGYPFHAGNGAINCTVYSGFKLPFTPGNPNADRNIQLYLDTGTSWNNSSYADISGVVYTLVDGNDRLYQLDPYLTTSLQPGRRLLGFLVPKEAVAKRLIVDPSGNPDGGGLFNVDLGWVLNASDRNVTILYYGVIGSVLDSNRKSITIDIGITNNMTGRLNLSPENFTLLDQWGWVYRSADVFERKMLEPNETLRTSLGFKWLSPQSRPAELVYRYSGGDPLVIEIEPVRGNETNLEDEGATEPGTDSGTTCGSCSQAENSGTVSGKVAEAKARLSGVTAKNQNTDGGSSGSGGGSSSDPFAGF